MNSATVAASVNSAAQPRLNPFNWKSTPHRARFGYTVGDLLSVMAEIGLTDRTKIFILAVIAAARGEETFNAYFAQIGVLLRQFDFHPPINLDTDPFSVAAELLEKGERQRCSSLTGKRFNQCTIDCGQHGFPNLVTYERGELTNGKYEPGRFSIADIIKLMSDIYTEAKCVSVETKKSFGFCFDQAKRKIVRERRQMPDSDAQIGERLEQAAKKSPTEQRNAFRPASLDDLAQQTEQLAQRYLAAWQKSGWTSEEIARAIASAIEPLQKMILDAMPNWYDDDPDPDPGQGSQIGHVHMIEEVQGGDISTPDDQPIFDSKRTFEPPPPLPSKLEGRSKPEIPQNQMDDSHAVFGKQPFSEKPGEDEQEIAVEDPLLQQVLDMFSGAVVSVTEPDNQPETATKLPPVAMEQRQAECELFFETLTNLGVETCDITILEPVVDGEPKRVRGSQPALPVAVAAQQCWETIVECEHNPASVIVRPRLGQQQPGYRLIQLDDLDKSAVCRVSQQGCLVIETSPGRYQVWVAVLETGSQTLRSRLIAWLGADAGANASVRVPGSRNAKEKHAPHGQQYPVVRLCRAAPRTTTVTALEELGLPPAIQVQRPPGATMQPPQSPARFPDYQKCLDNAPAAQNHKGPDRSKADFTWARTALQWGHTPEATAAELAQISAKAKQRQNPTKYAEDVVAAARRSL